MLLPLPVNRPALRGFWLFVSFLIGLVAILIGSLASAGDWGQRLLIGLAISTAVAVPGLADPYLVWWPYRVWNWVVRRFSRLAIRYVSAVAFWTVVVPLGWVAKPRFFERSPSSSTWRPRGTQPASSYPSQHHEAGLRREVSWREHLASWRRASGHRQAWLLDPFLATIAALDADPTAEQTAPRNIYTLY